MSYELRPVTGIGNKNIYGNLTPAYIETYYELCKTLGFDAKEANLSSAEDQFKLPMVVILNGPGGSGKDTLYEMIKDYMPNKNEVLRVSTVDLVYDAMEALFSTETRGDVLAGKEQKEDAYRQLMHEVKMSWTKYCDGPTQYIVDYYNNIVKNVSTRDIQPVKLMFTMLREPEEIVKLKEHFNKSGIIVLTMYIFGRTSPTDYQNDCDANVNNLPEGFSYDVEIDNSGDLDTLKIAAATIAKALSDLYDSDHYLIRRPYEKSPNLISVPDSNQITATTEE